MWNVFLLMVFVHDFAIKIPNHMIGHPFAGEGVVFIQVRAVAGYGRIYPSIAVVAVGIVSVIMI